MEPKHPDPVDHVPAEHIAATYDERGLDRLTDDDLTDAVAAIVARPRRDPADSFVLHAPLELTARARLLALLPRSDQPETAAIRRLARLRLVSIAARYQTGPPADLDDALGDPAAVAATTATTAADAVDAVIGAVAAGDLPAVDIAVRTLVARSTSERSTVDVVGSRLAPALAASTAAAAHAPIFLATLAEIGDEAARWLPLLRPLTRELARRPDWRLRWLEHRPPAEGPTPADPDALFRVLADPPRLGIPGSTFIHPTLQQVDRSEVAGDLLGPLVGLGMPLDPAAGQAVTRVAALSMVHDTPDHAPYGWTHCLTLPQAILTVAPWLDRAGVPALAIAATQVLGLRASLATTTLDPDDELIRPADPATSPARRARLVAEAGSRHDAHIAKYLLAALTAADRDPEAGHLHLAAAERLLAVWDAAGPDPDDLLAAEVDRLDRPDRL